MSRRCTIRRTIPRCTVFHTPAPCREDHGRTFVIAGAGELLEGELVRDGIVRRGETGPDAMREKAAYVVHVMADRLAGLGSELGSGDCRGCLHGAPVGPPSGGCRVAWRRGGAASRPPVVPGATARDRDRIRDGPPRYQEGNPHLTSPVMCECGWPRANAIRRPSQDGPDATFGPSCRAILRYQEYLARRQSAFEQPVGFPGIRQGQRTVDPQTELPGLNPA